MSHLTYFSPSHLASYSEGIGGGLVCKDVLLKLDENLPLSKVLPWTFLRGTVACHTIHYHHY